MTKIKQGLQAGLTLALPIVGMVAGAAFMGVTSEGRRNTSVDVADLSESRRQAMHAIFEREVSACEAIKHTRMLARGVPLTDLNRIRVREECETKVTQ